MICSGSELEATLQKAGLGAGLPVGLAEDAAAAGLWLAINGLDGAGAVLAAVQAERRDVVIAGGAATVIRHTQAVFAGPFAVDVVLADRSSAVSMLDVDVPALVLGLAGAASAAHRAAFDLRWGDTGSALASAGRLRLAGKVPMPGTSVTLARAADPVEESARIRRPDGIEVDDGAWLALTRLAARTYVPASESSRERGAGAGLTDND